MDIRNITEEKPFFSKEKLSAWKVFEGKESAQILMVLQPGAILAPHTTDFDAQFHVAKGKLDLQIGDISKTLTENQISKCKGNVPHGLKNPYQETVNVLITKIFS